MKPSIKEFTKIDVTVTPYSMKGIKSNARIRVEQDADLSVKSLKIRILGQPHDEVIVTTDKRFKHYKAIENRIILKDGLLFRKYYGETGNVNKHQSLIPKQIVNEKLRRQQEEFGKHPGTTKTMIAHRGLYYYPNKAHLITEWVMSCEKCIREPRIIRSLTHPHLQKPNGHITAPEDTMQIDLVPEIALSVGFENIVTALDVFLRYLFAYSTSNQEARTIANSSLLY